MASGAPSPTTSGEGSGGGASSSDFVFRRSNSNAPFALKTTASTPSTSVVIFTGACSITTLTSDPTGVSLIGMIIRDSVSVVLDPSSARSTDENPIAPSVSSSGRTTSGTSYRGALGSSTRTRTTPLSYADILSRSGAVEEELVLDEASSSSSPSRRRSAVATLTSNFSGSASPEIANPPAATR